MVEYSYGMPASKHLRLQRERKPEVNNYAITETFYESQTDKMIRSKLNF